jgi:OmpA-OmpF porin, OOP family
MKLKSIGLVCLALLLGAGLSGCGCVQQSMKGEVAPPPPVAAQLESSGSVRLDIEFDTAKWDVKPKYDDELKQVADFMKAHPETKLEIQGHTDNVGTEASNIKLSQERADSVKGYLVNKFGIASNRLRAVGYGPNKPIASNGTGEGRQKNRRVEAVVEKAAR